MSNLIIPIISLWKSAGLNQARSALMGASKDFNGFAQSIGKAASAFAGFQALSTAQQFTVESVELTNRFERNMLALAQVFEDATPQLRAFTKEVENYGLSQSQAAQASVFLGSVLKQYGFTIEESATQTQRLVTLAQDLATTFGYDVETALVAITALFRGEYDPIEKFGVAMKQSEINARLASEGLGDLEGAELALAQAQTRLTMLFERADDAVGAFTRASDTLYASQQRLAAIVQNVQIAFGAPLQKPLAQVNNLFADLAQEFGPELTEVSQSLGEVIQTVTPTIGKLGESFFTLIRLLEPLLDLLNGLLNAITLLANPILDLANYITNELAEALDGIALGFDALLYHINRLLEKGNIKIAYDWDDSTAKKILDWFFDVENARALQEERVKRSMGVYDSEARAEEARINRLQTMGWTFEDLGKSADEARTYFQTALEALGTYSKDAEGKLSGLALLFTEIDEAAKKSEAKSALEDLGFAAGQIEQILTRPDWATIFGEITRLAGIASIKITQFTSGAQLALITQSKAALQKLLDSLTIDDAGSKVKDSVAEFYNGIKDEIAKQNARLKLEKLGASEGLIEQILGSQGWEKVYKRVTSSGTEGIKKLQDQFNRTAAGIKEIQKDLDEAKKIADEALEAQKKLADEIAQKFEDAKDAAAEFRKQMAGLAGIDVLPTFEAQVGRFEAQIVSSFDNIKESIKAAFDAGVITKESYDSLVTYAKTEADLMRAVARQRDELAERYTLAESLIAEYKSAFTAAMSLSGLMSQLKKETEKQTVTEIRKGVIALGSSLREFNFTVTREYEQTIDTVVNKSQVLLDGFRSMAEKARAFAQNLRQLKALGLDPQLFNEIVQAGVEAGSETAQALVDGGADSIKEINAIYKEIGQLGADLGEEVASKLYGSGVDMSKGLLAGIKSLQADFELEAQNLAKTFATAFATEIETAIKAALKAIGYLDRPTPGATQVEQILSGGGVSIPGAISTLPTPGVGLPSLNPIGGGLKFGSGGVTNNYNVTVQADTRAGGAKAGEAAVTALKAFTNQNGGLNAWVAI